MMQSYIEEVKKRNIQYEGLKDDLASHQKELLVNQNELKRFVEAKALIQKVSNDMNDLISFGLVDITQAMLDSVFPSEYKVKIDFTMKNNRTHVDIYLDMDGEKIYPLDQDGGGVANIMELGLRLASLQLGKTRRTIVLDQPLKDLSREFLPIGANILKKISRDLNLQLIIINHVPEFMDIADKTFKFTKNLDTGISSVKVIKEYNPKEKDVSTEEY